MARSLAVFDCNLVVARGFFGIPIAKLKAAVNGKGVKQDYGDFFQADVGSVESVKLQLYGTLQHLIKAIMLRQRQ